jgi:hypothetical protein
MAASSRSLLFGIGSLRLLAVSHRGALGQWELIDKAGIIGPDQHHPKHPDGLGNGSLGPGITISELQQRIAFEELPNLSDSQFLKLLVLPKVSLDEIKVFPVGIERSLLFAVLAKMVDEGGTGFMNGHICHGVYSFVCEAGCLTQKLIDLPEQLFDMSERSHMSPVYVLLPGIFSQLLLNPPNVLSNIGLAFFVGRSGIVTVFNLFHRASPASVYRLAGPSRVMSNDAYISLEIKYLQRCFCIKSTNLNERSATC